MRRIAVIFVSVVIMLLGLAVGSASADKRQERCFNTGCYAKDPVKTGCLADAKTIAAMDVSGTGMLELRWSKGCGAGWGRFSGYTRGGYNLGHITFETTTTMSPFIAQGNADAPGSVEKGMSYWSLMVPDEKAFCTRVQLHIFGSTPGKMSYEEIDSWWSNKLCSIYI